MANSFKQMIKDKTIKRSDTGMFIRLDDIHVKPGFNNREDDDRTRQANDELFDYLMSGGTVPPIEVRPREDGGIWVTEGHRRTAMYRRCRDAGKPVEWIAIVPAQGNDVDQLARRYTSNNQLELTPYEQAMGLRDFAPFNLSIDEIAKLIHKSRSHVEMLFELLNANHDVQQLVKVDAVAPAAAVARVKEHGEKAGEILKEDVEAAKAAGKKRVTKSMVTEKQFSAKSARRLCELIAHSAPIVQGDHDYLLLPNGVKDEVMAILEEFKLLEKRGEA